jgi:hypothetical protein
MSKHRLRKRYGHSAHTLTFGVVPPFDEFKHHIESGVNDEGHRFLSAGSKYPIEASSSDAELFDKLKLVPTGVGAYGKPKYEFTAKQLHSLLKKLVRKGETTKDDELRESAESMASAIMSTLGYEWF